MNEVLILSGSDVKKLLSMHDIVGAVEEAFRAYGKGESKVAPVILTLIDSHEGEHEIKSGYVENYCIGAKVVTYYKNNRAKHGRPALSGTIILNDLNDGRPLAILDGTYITAARTGAAGAVAAKYLSRENSAGVGVIGAGTQGRYQISALNEVRKIESVRIYDINAESAAEYVKEMRQNYPFKFEQAKTPREAVQGSDIIITVTPSTEPIVFDEWITDGVHINAIGADSPGKQELDPKIVARAKVIVDSVNQCIGRGEIQTAIREGMLRKETIYAELADIVLGRKKGRVNSQEITLFDATGLAVQDITTAYTVYTLARKKGIGVTFRLD